MFFLVRSRENSSPLSIGSASFCTFEYRPKTPSNEAHFILTNVGECGQKPEDVLCSDNTAIVIAKEKQEIVWAQMVTPEEREYVETEGPKFIAQAKELLQKAANNSNS